MANEPRLLWQPSPERIARSNLAAFMKRVEADWGARTGDYLALYDWSIAEPEKFWRSLWSFAGVIAETQGTTVLVDGGKMPGARWFPEARLNFAENLLRRRDRSEALVFWGEDGATRRLSWADLWDETSRLAQALRDFGVGPGDRVAAYMPNTPEAVIAMLAATSLGAVWSSASPDFGVEGLLDRFGQIAPKVLFAGDGYFYNGRRFGTLGKLTEIARRLPSAEHLIVVPFTCENPPIEEVPKAIGLDEAVAAYTPGDIEFARLGFNHPLYIVFSSGTTGKPKCIVHGVGGSLLQHLKEHQLLSDIHPGEKLFFFTTCGWMVWNWLVGALASEATVMLYDGNPFHPDANALFDYAQAERFDVFGMSAKFIEAIRKEGLEPAKTHDLSSVRTILSTGSPLAPEGFDYVYERIKRDVCLSSISGGTDLMGCFIGGNPTGPVWRGELQARALAMDVRVFDDKGREQVGETGELVCVSPFPSMPVGFWNDPGDARYRAAYFEKFPGVWTHGDWVELTERGGMIVHGRSDAVLNPGGVRIGTAEIYRQVERLDEVVESLVIGQCWADDVRVVLFVRMKDGLTLDKALIERIKRAICEHASPRHVPAKVIQVADIPRTKSGKIVELAVRDIVHGREVTNAEALANPEALELFRGLAELRA